MKTARKEQPAIHLRHMEEKFGGLTVPKKGRARTQHRLPTNQLTNMDGPNVCRRQPRPRYAGAEDKLIAETQQHMEEQFTVLGDQIRALTTQFSNMDGHNGDGSGDPSAERETHEHQHHAQTHANQWGNGFKVNILKFQGDLQPEEFLDWVMAVEEVFEFNRVPDEQRVSLVVHTFRGRVVAWWQQLKQSRVRQGQLKINSWEKLLKKM
jgi:G3E family GTPase